MEARPNEPGASRRNREEGGTSRAPSDVGAPGARAQKSGAWSEEEWFSLGTDDPAFWLKEPGRD